MPLSEYDKQRMQHILNDRPEPEKTRKRIRPISAKRAKKIAESKKTVDGDVTEKSQWFNDRRVELTGFCQCGCGRRSSKEDDISFRCSICHIFPQRLFKSIQFHPLNFVERAFYGGCHMNMDNLSMDLWPNMADWHVIKERFYILSPLLTEKEKARKFYKQLEYLVNGN